MIMSSDVLLPPTEVDRLKALPRRDATRILTLLERLREDPYPAGVHRVRGVDGLWIARVDRYRIAYTVRPEEHQVVIVRLSRETDAASSESIQ